MASPDSIEINGNTYKKLGNIKGAGWTTGSGAPTKNGIIEGDLYLDKDTGKVYLWSNSSWTENGELAGKITIDSALSSTSTNPVQNKVIKSALDGKAGSSHDHTISDITGLYDELTGMTYVTDSSDNSVQLETYGDGNSFSIPTKGYVDSALNGKSDVGHTHKKSEITDLTIPTVNNPTITINQGGTKKGSFTLNQSGNTTIDLTDNDTTYSTATQSSNGLMSASDKKKLDGIAESANKITVDSSLSSTSTNPVQNKVINSALGKKADSGHSHSYLMNSSGRQFNVPTGGSGGEQKTLVITDDLNAYQPKGSYASSSHTHDYLPLTGGALTGNLSLKEYKNILLRPNNSSYTSGIGYDTRGNECIALWAKNSVTRLRWNAGVDMSELTSGKMMDITPDFEISKADGTAKGYIAGQQIIHSGSIGSQNVNYANSAGDADTLDGSHASSFARIAADNNLMYHTDEFTFASSGFSGTIWLNYRTAGGTNGNITEYKLGNGAGGALGSIIHSGNIGSQSVNYANSAGSADALNSLGKISCLSGTSRYDSGLRTHQVYSNGYPFSYGSSITIENGFGAEIIFNGLGGGGNTGSGEMQFRTHSDWSSSEWGGWRTVIDSSNIGSQNVNYANSAGSARASNISMSFSNGVLTITYN